LIKWLRKKYKVGVWGAAAKLNLLKVQYPKLFFHWEVGLC